MLPIGTDQAVWSVCHTSENGWTDQDVVWVEDSGEVLILRGNGQFLEGTTAHCKA